MIFPDITDILSDRNDFTQSQLHYLSNRTNHYFSTCGKEVFWKACCWQSQPLK